MTNNDYIDYINAAFMCWWLGCALKSMLTGKLGTIHVACACLLAALLFADRLGIVPR